MSFAAEMKDFVSAWTAVNEMGVSKRKLDLQKEELAALVKYREDTLALDRDQFELSRANSARSAALAAERNQIARDAAEAAKMNGVFESLGNVDNVELDWSMGTDPASGAAIPTDEEYPATDSMGNAFSRGGMVALAVDGGLLEEDPDLPFVDKQNPYVDPKMNERARAAQAIPAAPVAAQPSYDAMGNATGFTESSPEPAAQPDPKAAESVVADAQKAVADAAPALVSDVNKPAAAVGPEAEEERMDIVNNTGGLSLDEYKQLIATIDPNDSIPAYLKSAAVLASTHRYFMENGQPEKAQRIAKGILILNKQMTQTLGALAQNAMEEGDVNAAAELVSNAGNQFPTGHQFRIAPDENGNMTYTVMQNGKPTATGALTADQLWELTGKVKDGSLYIEEMGRLASAGQGQRRVGPTEALDLTANAYVRAMQAVEALDTAEQEGASEEELKALRGEARNAKAIYDKFYNNAMSMGLKRTDIMARGDQMLEMAIPEDPQAAEGGSAAGEQSWASWLLGRANPVTALRDDYQMLMGDESGVTSQGNAVQFDSLPTPRTREERDALPPGTQYVAPDGSIRTR